MIGTYWIDCHFEGEDRLIDLNSLYCFTKEKDKDLYIIKGFLKCKDGKIHIFKSTSEQERDEYWEKIKQSIVNTI